MKDNRRELAYHDTRHDLIIKDKFLFITYSTTNVTLEARRNTDMQKQHYLFHG